MSSISRYSTFVATTLVLAACASAPQTDTSVAEPCTVRPEDSIQWKQVQGINFTFCVPMDWKRVGGQSWQSANETVTWSLMETRQSITVQRMDGPRSSVPRPTSTPLVRGPAFVETIGGVPVSIRSSIAQSGYELSAEWETPPLRITGTARTPEGDALVKDIFRTVRLTR